MKIAHHSVMLSARFSHIVFWLVVCW